MKQQRINYIFGALVVLGLSTQSMLVAESKIGYCKILKVAWHAAEVFAGFYIGNNHFALKRGTKSARISYGVATISLLGHGILGLNKELKIIEHI